MNNDLLFDVASIGEFQQLVKRSRERRPALAASAADRQNTKHPQNRMKSELA
jgi:hypothetical protein